MSRYWDVSDQQNLFKYEAQKKYSQSKWSNFQPSGLMRPQLIPSHKFPLTETMSCSIAIHMFLLWLGVARKTVGIYLWLATSTDRMHENVCEPELQLVFVKCARRAKYEKWSRGMRWYLWNNSYGCFVASTMNSYKCFKCKRRNSIFFLLEGSELIAFQHTEENISSFYTFSSDSSRSILLIRLRVSCNAIFIRFSKSHMFLASQARRVRVMIWLK